ncbi:MAG: exodeoxyribonuclease VII small subunit [Bacteroidetes bacterium]|nr:exodeoxyribonuclease VII small subunit [Bacteroidota bacterium]
MSKDQHTYEDALNELQTIVKEIEAGNIGIDALSEKVKRASALIKICRNKLESTEKEVSELLKGLDK